MTKPMTAIGMLLLVGAVFLSLNALAVSARPGDVSQAEKTTSIGSATAAVPQVVGSGTVAPTGGVVAVPLPLPATNPTAEVSARNVAMRPVTTPIGGPTVAPGPGVTPPSATLTQGGTVSVGPGIYSSSPGAASPIAPGDDGMMHPGLTPIPVPPVTPQPAKPGPVPVPPYSVDPARDGL